MIEYTWNKGAPFTHLDAARIGPELDALRDKDGALQIADVPGFAADNPDSELFRAFEWDDVRCGTEYRLTQARSLVGAVRHRKVNGGEVAVHRTHFGVGGGVYASVKAVRKNEGYQDALRVAAIRSLEAWRDRYAEIAELCGLSVADVNALIDTLKKADAVFLAAAE